MKYAALVLVLTAAAGAQRIVVLNNARDSVENASAKRAHAGDDAKASGKGAAAEAKTISLGDGTSFSDIPGKRDPNKKIVIPDSLKPQPEAAPTLGALGGVTTESSLGDSAQKFKDAKQMKPAATSVYAFEPPLHFDAIVSGIDPVAVTVRDFQNYANDHTRHETELRVKQWAQEGYALVPTNPAAMRDRDTFNNSVVMMRSIGFPRAWLEAPKADGTKDLAKGNTK